MPYKPTGNPPGRPRKTAPVVSGEPRVEPSSAHAEPTKPLERAREGFRRAAGDPTADLHRPPRQGKRRKQEVSRRPVLHPNVIRG
jgi:hypothetical protein